MEYTTEENQELVETIKRPIRHYKVTINGYGGEAAYCNLTKEQYEFWSKHIEEHGDCDAIAYMVGCEDNEFDFENIEELPEGIDFQVDEDGYRYPWYESPAEYEHQYGVSYNAAYLIVDEVDSDDYGADTIAEVIDREALDEYVEGLHEAWDYDTEIVSMGVSEGEEGDYVMQFYSSEKGCFWEGIITTTGAFDPKKLMFRTTEYPNGEDILTEVEYDNEVVDNDGGDTNGKGYSVHVWSNK